MGDDIEIHMLKKIDLKGATVIDGFPSVGLVSSIVANYIVRVLSLEQVGVLDSVYFPPLSLVRGAEPLDAVRIYAGPRVGTDTSHDQIAVVISEFQPPPNLVRAIASSMLDWLQEERCKMLFSPEGLVIEREGEDEKEEKRGEAEAVREVETYGIGSTPRARRLLEESGVRLFKEGVITGMAGVLLNEGKRRDFDVVALLAEANPQYPDARAAAKVIETLDRLILHIRLDSRPLYKEAEVIESQIKSIQQQTKVPKQTPAPHMYG
ncbi:MAG: PAC2 family protein [Thermoplasmata archaeon]